jgi:putative transposase
MNGALTAGPHECTIATNAYLLSYCESWLISSSFSFAAMDLMRRIDELHLEQPFAGSRMLRDFLNRESFPVGRRHGGTLRKRMGIEALYRRPNTLKPALGHKSYPYLLRGLKVERPNHVWATDITYISMARGFVYLVAVVDWFSRRVLSHRVSITMEADF